MVLLDVGAAFASPASPCQDPVAAPGDPVHPDGVQDVQTDAGDDPSHLGSHSQADEGGGPEGGPHPGVVGGDDGDADQEEDQRHHDTVGHHQPVGAWDGEDLEKPSAEKQTSDLRFFTSWQRQVKE